MDPLQVNARQRSYRVMLIQTETRLTKFELMLDNVWPNSSWDGLASHTNWVGPSTLVKLQTVKIKIKNQFIINVKYLKINLEFKSIIRS